MGADRIMSSKKRIVSLELVRIVSCIGVIICHFNASVCGWNNGLVYPQNCIIPSWYFEGRLYTGDVGVSMFFILSGATLMLTYKPNNLRQYYKKRFMAIYPMFWIAWFVATSFDLMYFKGMSSVHPGWLLTSLCGMDGYLGMHGIGVAGSFYKVGEWFLGCILLIYLVFPLVYWCVEKRPAVTLLGASILSLVFMKGIKVGTYNINSYSFFVRIPEIILGMMFIKYNMREKLNSLLAISGSCALLAVITRRWIPPLLFCIAMCMLFFSLLIFIGEKITSERVKQVLINFGAITFPIFLVHHWLSDRIVMGFNLENMTSRVVLFLCMLYMVLVLLLSKLLVWSSNKIMASIAK